MSRLSVRRVPLAKTSIPTGNGGRVELDGAAEDLSVLVEAYAHQGALRGGQPKKRATDALKLTWIGRQVGATKLILAIADEQVEAYLRRPKAWLTQALIDLDVEVIRVDLAAHGKALTNPCDSVVTGSIISVIVNGDRGEHGGGFLGTHRRAAP